MFSQILPNYCTITSSAYDAIQEVCDLRISDTNYRTLGGNYHPHDHHKISIYRLIVTRFVMCLFSIGKDPVYHSVQSDTDNIVFFYQVFYAAQKQCRTKNTYE